jgi:VWFA-related protein
MLLSPLAFALALVQAPAPAGHGAPTRGAEALSLFGTADDDRTLVYLAWGPPAERTRIECPAVFRGAEVWTYAQHPRLGPAARLVFFQEPGSGEFRVWTAADGDAALIAPKAAGPLQELAAKTAGCAEGPLLLDAVRAARSRQGDAGSAERDAVAVGRRPRPTPPPKGSGALEMPAGATPLSIRKSVGFEAAPKGTRLELSLMLERSGLTARTLGDETFFAVDVTGEVRKGAKAVEDFRYRFDFAGSSLSGSSVPLQIEKDLAPGDYTLKVRVSDVYANSAALLEERLKVPAQVKPPEGEEERAAREAASASAAARAEETAGASGTLTLVRPLVDVATGRLHLETRTSSSEIASVEFTLDGARVLTKRRPPFEADVELGEEPRKHVVQAIGYGRDGNVVSRDELTLNEGREAFRVHITYPEQGRQLAGPVRVSVELSIPGTRTLKQLEIYLDDTRAAVLYKPPYDETIDVPPANAITVLRAVATLDDGASAEDVRYLNAPSLLSEVNVEAVQVFASVFAKSRPVTGLSKESFRVLEDGVPQDVSGFEVVTKLPLALGLAIDTSDSMEESMGEVRKAATEFLKDLMTPRDRCFLVSFSSEPLLASRFTNDRERIAAALDGLTAKGMTAIWDAIQTGLFQFQGIRGRKAYVILTDGEDNASKRKYDSVVDYARRSGVAVYFIAMKIPISRPDIRFKLGRIASETGGAVFSVESASGLPRIYKQIDEELRSQYLLSYVPKRALGPGKWRKVEVKMTPANLTARTIAGYYP